jgi:hypothetical protein
MKKEITIKFDNAKAALHFAHWLCGSGEQQYWEWMQYREEEEPGNITAVSFDYHAEDTSKDVSDPKRYGKFMGDGIIRTTCSRLDKK